MAKLESLVSWHSDWKDLRVAVIGLGVTGFSVADTLAELGAQLLVVAEKAEPDLLDILDVIGVEHLVGELAAGVPQRLEEFEPELVVTSPGVRPDSQVIVWAQERGIPIWVDIDLAWRLRDKTDEVADWICITGTNGKTTTTQLTAAILDEGGLRSVAVGNIGTPILDAIRDPFGYEVLVVELSSFQLHYMGPIEPHSSVVLNLADDHLDWHGGFENYRAAKAKIYQNTKYSCVYNVQDMATETMVEEAEVQEGARAIGFSLGAPSRSQVGYVEDLLVDRAFLEERATTALELARIEDIAHIGVITPHLLANVAAAAALARSIGIEPVEIRDAIRDFRLDSHRIELVADHDGVRWIDDSKATNPHATAASLKSFESVVWVVGGLLKGVALDELIETFADRLRAAVVIGVDREPVLAALREHAPQVPVCEVTADGSEAVMREAVAFAADQAQPGDTVLLAPAAASMDQFRDYADRGEKFAQAVNEWISKRGTDG